MTFWSSWGLQDASSPLMEQLIFFHDHAMMVIILIISLVGFMSFSLVTGSFSGRYLLEYQEVEAVWTVLPGVFLVFLALPSLRLLYLLDEINDSVLTLKVVGHQWYWSYEYSDFLDVEYDSYMVASEELSSGDYRLLEVDHRTVVPFSVDVRVLVTAADVLHSWTVPSLGVKADAVPGRLNQLSFFCSRSGVFYGQCSEICGANHSFMPIVVESVSVSDFVSWIKSVGF
uniref:Cytochrome c oxidase subunit 2 n=1 Tax=Paranemertes cf. peregrina SCS-2010 TaxID=743461 RepID=E7C1A6_9BILA|nr:cytochrome c oxidase subunit II [Paranemertes cf. peregrina SCS-2010]ADD62166.1 cytochrome c oxidase subunit II [Paranemertes cf. peregrina SCS-2010]